MRLLPLLVHSLRRLQLKQASFHRSLGVSNFNVEELQAILDIATVKPVVNQVRHESVSTSLAKQTHVLSRLYPF